MVIPPSALFLQKEEQMNRKVIISLGILLLDGLNKVLGLAHILELNDEGGFPVVFFHFHNGEAVRAPSDLLNLFLHFIGAHFLRAELNPDGCGDELAIQCGVPTHCHIVIPSLVFEGTVRVPPIECEAFLGWIIWERNV